jgi:hypothetical protein
VVANILLIAVRGGKGNDIRRLLQRETLLPKEIAGINEVFGIVIPGLE